MVSSGSITSLACMLLLIAFTAHDLNCQARRALLQEETLTTIQCNVLTGNSTLICNGTVITAIAEGLCNGSLNQDYDQIFCTGSTKFPSNMTGTVACIEPSTNGITVPSTPITIAPSTLTCTVVGSSALLGSFTAICGVTFTGIIGVGTCKWENFTLLGTPIPFPLNP